MAARLASHRDFDDIPAAPSAKRHRPNPPSHHHLPPHASARKPLQRTDSTASLPTPPGTIDTRLDDPFSSESDSRFDHDRLSSSPTAMDLDSHPPKRGHPHGHVREELDNPFFVAPRAAAAARQQQNGVLPSSRHLFAAQAGGGSPTSSAARRRALRIKNDPDRIATREGRGLDEDSDEEMGQRQQDEEEPSDEMGRSSPGNVFLMKPGEIRRGKNIAEWEEREGGRKPGIAMTYVFRGKRITYDSVPAELAFESPFQPKFLFPTPVTPPPPSRPAASQGSFLASLQAASSSSPTRGPLAPATPRHERVQRKETEVVVGLPTPAKTVERERGRKKFEPYGLAQGRNGKHGRGLSFGASATVATNVNANAVRTAPSAGVMASPKKSQQQFRGIR